MVLKVSKHNHLGGMQISKHGTQESGCIILHKLFIFFYCQMILKPINKFLSHLKGPFNFLNNLIESH